MKQGVNVLCVKAILTSYKFTCAIIHPIVLYLIFKIHHAEY